MLLLELQRHATLLVARIEHSGRHSRDLAGEKAELQQARTLIATLAAHYARHPQLPVAPPVLSSEESH